MPEKRTKASPSAAPAPSGWYRNAAGDLCNDSGCVHIVASKNGFEIEFDDDAESCDIQHAREARELAAEAAMSGNIKLSRRKR